MQILLFSCQNRQSLQCKTIGIAGQNDRFCNSASRDLLHTFFAVWVNIRNISVLRLLAQNSRNNDYGITFSFSDEFWRANIVNVEC